MSLETDEAYEGELAAGLVDEALERSGMTRAAARDVFEAAYGLAAGHSGPPGTWPRQSTREREAAVLGRLLRRLVHTFGWPLESAQGVSAKAAVREALAPK